MSRKCVGITSGLVILVLVGVITPIALLVKPGNASTVPPIVDTPYGRIQGTERSTIDGDTVIRYAGVPFAKPPVGDLRFQPPQPIETKSPGKLIDAQKLKKSCWSITKKVTSPYYDEDCLYLNIYVPNKSRDNNRNQKYPVVVWIHGGGFVAGSTFPEPSSFVARGEVIVVTVNYRLGVFGFLTTEDEFLPANNGLWDQIMAMKMVKENIEYFGGDSNSITLFGESAGGVSVALLAISPESSNLFNRAIMQSGSASSLLRRNPTKTAKEFGKKAGCTQSNPKDFANCLSKLSVETILKFSKAMDIDDAGKLIEFFWIPTIDQVIIPDEPTRLLNNETYLASINAFEKDYLFGLNNNDGSLAIQNFMNPFPADTVVDANFFKLFTKTLLTLTQDVPTASMKSVSDLVTSFYTGSQTQDNIRVESLMDLTADAMFYAPEISMATAMSGCYEDLSTQVCESNISQILDRPECVGASGRSFIYVFDFCPPRDGCKLPCMTHGLQVLYQFPKRAFKNSLDQELSDKFIDLLTDFVKTGQPGSNMTSQEWPAFERNLQSYLSFSPFPIVRQYLHPYRMDLWLSKIPELL